MSSYGYKSHPITSLVARELVLEYLAGKSGPVPRSELRAYVVASHARGGGAPTSEANLMASLKSAISGLMTSGLLHRPLVGWYSLSAPGSPTADPADLVDESDDVQQALVVERQIGAGEESAYVYFYETDRKLALLEGKAIWPCKIGFSSTDPITRIISQCSSTNTVYLPVVGLVIRVGNGRATERAIHAALDEVGARIGDAIGAEWFNTSPEKIRAWYSAYQATLDALRDQPEGKFACAVI